MTKRNPFLAEYEEKRLALISHYLHLSMVVGGGAPMAESLARQLADALDRLALEIDPFAGKPGAPAAGGSQHVR